MTAAEVIHYMGDQFCGTSGNCYFDEFRAEGKVFMQVKITVSEASCFKEPFVKYVTQEKRRVISSSCDSRHKFFEVSYIFFVIGGLKNVDLCVTYFTNGPFFFALFLPTTNVCKNIPDFRVSVKCLI